MVDGQERFIDMICEMTGEKCPSDIRQEELAKFIASQVMDRDHTLGELLYGTIFDDIGFYDG